MFDAWKDAAVENAAAYIGWGGLLIGIVFGAIVTRTNFCTMGSLSDIANFGDWRRFRSWLLAAAVAMLGVLWIERTGLGDMQASLYLAPRLTLGGNVLGGLLFGSGMVLARDLIGSNGMMMLSAEHVLDAEMIQKLLDFEKSFGVGLTVHIKA